MRQKHFNVAVVGHPQSGKSSLIERLNRRNASNGIISFSEQEGVQVLRPGDSGAKATYKNLVLGLSDGTGSPDALLLLLNAMALDQQLFLACQVLDLRLPTVVVLTFPKTAELMGLKIDVERLEQWLRRPCFALPERGEKHFDDLERAIEKAVGEPSKVKELHWRPSLGLANAYNLLDSQWLSKHSSLHDGGRLIEGLRLISETEAHHDYQSHPAAAALRRYIKDARVLMEERKEDWRQTEALQRGFWVGTVFDDVVVEGVALNWRQKAHLRLASFPKKWLWVAFFFFLFIATASLTVLLQM